jgi:hypothetical protein
MVLSGGFTCREVDVLSKPRTETSSGTRSPRRYSSLTTAAPISSLTAKIVGVAVVSLVRCLDSQDMRQPSYKTLR